MASCDSCDSCDSAQKKMNLAEGLVHVGEDCLTEDSDCMGMSRGEFAVSLPVRCPRDMSALYQLLLIEYVLTKALRVYGYDVGALRYFLLQDAYVVEQTGVAKHCFGYVKPYRIQSRDGFQVCLGLKLLESGPRVSLGSFKLNE